MRVGQTIRLREIIKHLLPAEIVGLTVTAALASILTFVGWQVWVVMLSVMTAFLLFWAVRSVKPIQLSRELTEDEQKSDGRISLEVPTSHDMLVAANRHARSLYGKGSPSLTEVEMWSKRNPLVFGVLRSEWGAYLGYFDVLPLNDEGTRLLESGQISEREIQVDHILPRPSMREAKTLYVAGVAVEEAGSVPGKVRTARLMEGLAVYIEHYYGHVHRRIIALAATPEGGRVLKSIDARVCCSGHARKDRHDLYEVMVTPKLLSEIKARASRRGIPLQAKLGDAAE